MFKVSAAGESKDFRNILQTLERIFAAPSLGGAFAQKAATELVEWMTPHALYYKRFLVKDAVASAGSPTSIPMSDMLRSSPWLPSWHGDRLLTLGNGWVPVPGQSEVTARQSKFLASSAFHSVVHQFAEKWPFLHLAQWPTARIIVRTLKYQSSLPQPVWSSGEMSYVYKSLGWTLNHERISRTNWGAEPTPEACEVREYLLHEPWIFLPTRRRGNYKVHDEEAGKFYPSSSVAMYDASQLFSDRRAFRSSGYEYVSDEMAWTVSQKVFMRTAKEHYSDKVVQALLKEWGVAPHMGWDAYLDVLRMVDELANSESHDHVWEHDHALHEIVWRIVRLLGKIPVEEDAEDGKDRGDKLDENEAAQADEDAEFGRPGDFRQLVEEAKNLRIVWTSSRRFRKPSEVLFVADAKSWLDEAKHFATYVPKNLKDVMNGWIFLGLRRWEPWSTCQSILPQLKPPDIHEARFARAIYLGGVRSALMKFEAQNKNLTEEARDLIRKAWYLAISVKFFVCSGHSKEEALQAQQVIAVPRCRAQSIGNAVATATDNIASATLVTMREDIAVARVEKPILKTHMAGFILSEQRRQLAIALHVPPKAYAADVLQKHPEFAEMLFAELPHVCDDVSCIPEDAYAGLQKEAVKTLQNVSWDMWSQGTRGKNLPQTGDIIKAVEVSPPMARLRKAWQRLLEGEDLFQNEEEEEEETVS
ncbi:unnamed protein product [Symbiodinium sp. CCMP2456]|nr:unnamed protein product [Symbiodinium sp. CCMP2456]